MPKILDITFVKEIDTLKCGIHSKDACFTEKPRKKILDQNLSICSRIMTAFFVGD